MRIFEEVAKVAGVKSERSRMIANARYHWGSWDSCAIGIKMFYWLLYTRDICHGDTDLCTHTKIPHMHDGGF